MGLKLFRFPMKIVCVFVLFSSVLSYVHHPPLLINNKGDGDDKMTCSEALTQTLMTIDDLVNVYLILSTGKYLDNWGAYGSCIDSVDGGTYWMVTTSGKPEGANEGQSEITFYTGLCVPADCTEKDMEQLNSLFLDAADFNDVKNASVTYFSVTGYVEEQQGALSIGEVIMGLVILTLMGLIGAGTLIHFTKLCDKPHINEVLNRNVGQGNTIEYNEIVSDGSVNPVAVSNEFDNDTATLYRKKIQATPFLAFSALRNAPSLVTPQKNAQIHPQSVGPDERPLQLSNGLRFYAMLWILYANTLAYTEKGVVQNIKDKPKMFKQFFFTLYPSAYFATDIFFFMSGFIAMYSISKLPNYSFVVILKQYLRRAYRLIPVIAFVMFTARYIVPRFVEGPMCQRYNLEFEDCDKYFWSNLLLINNLYPTGLSNNCMPWTWYFSCDFQLYLLVPLMAMLFRKSKIGGYVASISLVVISMILTAVLNGISDHPGASPYLDVHYLNNLYIKPWARATPYFLGVLMGSLFYNYVKNTDDNFMFNKIKHNPFLRGAMYAVGFALVFTIVFVIYDYNKDYGTGWSTGAKVVYTTIASFIFIVGLILLVLPALLYRAKLFRFLLIGPILALLGRVTYIVALAHPILMIGIYVTSGQQIYIEGYKIFAMFVGHAFLIYLVAVAVYLLVEAPLRNLERIWSDKEFAQNMVENWLTAKDFDKKPKNNKVFEEELKEN